MNKYWKFFADNACESRGSMYRTIFSFSKAMSIDLAISVLRQAKDIDPVKTTNISGVKILDEYFVKEDKRPVTKRFRKPKFTVHQVAGVRNLLGEAVNTLVANKIQFPSHKLLALEYRYLERKSAAIFERTSKKPALQIFENELTNTKDYSDYLVIIFEFFYQALLRGIFHGDSGLSNILFDENLEHGIYVDFECAVKLNRSVEDGLALQLANLGRHSTFQSLISAENYRDMVIDYLNQKFPKPEKYIELFLDFHAREHFRKAVLEKASLGNPDILLCLGKKDHE